MNKTKIVLGIILVLLVFFGFSFAGLAEKKETVKSVDESKTPGIDPDATKTKTSASANFILATDVLDAFGGSASSTNFTLGISSGGQPSVVGVSKSANFTAQHGYLNTASFVCGDANGDGKISVSDVVYLINYLFKGGPAPRPPETGNVNCDFKITVSDVVYLINYLFKGGPLPGQFCLLPVLGSRLSKLSLSSNPAKVGLVYPQALDQDIIEVPIFVKFDLDLAAAQFEIEYDPVKLEVLEPSLTPLTEKLELFSTIKDNTQKIGILDPKGENFIPAGEGDLLRLRIKGKDLESLKIKEAILVDRDANEIPVEIMALAKGEEEKESQALPKSFSLSQNYPNPFNPVTQISYALPADSRIKLTVYNILGQKVKVLVDEYQTAGYKSINWDGKDDQGKEVASGIYFYKIQAKDFSQSRKMVMMK